MENNNIQDASFRSRLCYSLVAEVMDQVERELLEVKTIQFLQHFTWSHGKRLRPIVFLLSNFSMRAYCSRSLVINKRESRFASAIELLHEASLIHDDLVDKSELRRGNPTLQMTHGEGLSLLVGDYMIFQSLKLILDAAESKQDILLARELADTGIHIAHGEAEQLERYLHQRDTHERMNINNYIGIIAKKTAAFFAGCAEAGAAIGGGEVEMRSIFRDFGMNLGLLFQMQDDMMDIYGNEKSAQKSLKNNISEGTMTLPLIHAWQIYSEDEIIQKLVKLELLNSDELKYLYQLLSDQKIISACKNTIFTYQEKAAAQLSLMPKNIYTLGLADIFEYIKQFSWGGMQWSITTT
jgi:geranylgeranyl pyrophosphate synthase